MPSDLHNLMPGQSVPPASASRTNAILATAREASGITLRQDRLTNHQFPQQQNTQIWVRNDTGHTFNRYDSVGLDEPIWLPADGESETTQHLNDPIYSISRLNHCRHRGRWAVLTAPLPPCGIVRAVMSGGTNAWIPTFAQMAGWSNVNPVSIDAAVYLDGALTSGGGIGAGQALWAGGATMPECAGTVDLECRGDGMKWIVIADNCSEGCSPFACGDEDFLPENLPCTPFDRIYNHECCPSKLTLLRISNATSNLRSNCHECFDANCKYECVQRGDEWVYQQIRNCSGEEITPTEAPDPSTTSGPTTTAAPCTGLCQWTADTDGGGWIVSPSNPWRMPDNPLLNECNASLSCFCPVPVGYPMSPTEENVKECEHPPETTAEPEEARCQCPDLNALVIDDPIRYPPCGPAKCPPVLLVACDTTTPEPTTTPPPTTDVPCTGFCTITCFGDGAGSYWWALGGDGCSDTLDCDCSAYTFNGANSPEECGVSLGYVNCDPSNGNIATNGTVGNSEAEPCRAACPTTSPPTTSPPSSTVGPTTTPAPTTPEPTTTAEPCGDFCEWCSTPVGGGGPPSWGHAPGSSGCDSLPNECQCRYQTCGGDPGLVCTDPEGEQVLGYDLGFDHECALGPSAWVLLPCRRVGDPPPPTTAAPTTTGTDPGTTSAPTTLDPSTTAVPTTLPSSTTSAPTTPAGTTPAPTTFPPTTADPCDTPFGCRYQCQDMMPPMGMYFWFLLNNNCSEHPNCSCPANAPGECGSCSAANNLALCGWIDCDRFD